jgi:hypothetical protein
MLLHGPNPVVELRPIGNDSRIYGAIEQPMPELLDPTETADRVLACCDALFVCHVATVDRPSRPRITAARDSLVLDYLIDAIDHAGDVAEELKKKGPEDFDARTLLDEDRQKRQY